MKVGELGGGKTASFAKQECVEPKKELGNKLNGHIDSFLKLLTICAFSSGHEHDKRCKGQAVRDCYRDDDT